MSRAALVLAALVALAGPARADAPDGGAAVVAADGGALDVPLQLAAGQPAPADGWWLSDERARLLVVNGQQCQAQLDAAQASPTKVALIVGVVAFVVGGGLAAYVAMRVR